MDAVLDTSASSVLGWRFGCFRFASPPSSIFDKSAGGDSFRLRFGVVIAEKSRMDGDTAAQSTYLRPYPGDDTAVLDADASGSLLDFLTAP